MSRFTILILAGCSSSLRTSDDLTLHNQPPQLSIVSPAPGAILAEGAPLRRLNCEWPSKLLADGTRSFYLDLSSCWDQNRTINYRLGLTVRDANGQMDSVEHLIGLSCDP